MTDRLAAGKVPWDAIAEVLEQDLPPEVQLGPAAGEDAALVEIGGETWAVATDPITFTAEDAGRLAVTVNANDIAVRGARPRFFTLAVLLSPTDESADRAREIITQARDACREIGAVLVGGHTEVTPGLAHSLVVGTMLGRVEGRPITTGELRAGDRIGMTRWAGIEGTAILLAEHGRRLRALHGDDAFAELEEVLSGGWLSVVPEALAAASAAATTSLHDVTEGGVGEALYELGVASGLRIEVDRGTVPVRRETAKMCADMGLDPLGLIGSGALLVGCAEGREAEVEAAVTLTGVPLTWIGRAVAGRPPGSSLPRFPRDELLRVEALDQIRFVLFDMDGTLVDSEYDWPAIRRRLGVEGGSIIDELNDLPEPERSEKWTRMCEIEREATERAELADGVPELLSLLRSKRMRTALVTNNTDANAIHLVERFGLELDLVLTRDCGMWKPSGAPLAEAMRRLGADPERTLAVGDSSYDLQAAREAGCARVCILNPDRERYRDDADLWFAGARGLMRYLEIVL